MTPSHVLKDALSINGWKASKTNSHTCGCIGPQNGEPLCPCRMRGVTVQNGRYVEIIDHGPVPTAERRDASKLNMAKYAAALLGFSDKDEEA